MTTDGLAERSEPQGSGQIDPLRVDFEQWIADAKGGCVESLGKAAERCRQYLLLVANRELDAGLRSKVAASDLVQEALLTAQQVFSRFEGKDETQLRLWLRAILLHKLAHASRSYYRVAKRDIRREQQLFAADSGGDGIDLVDQAPTPRGAALAKERALAIEAAIDRLPEHYRRVIRLRSFELRSFVEIGQILQTSGEAARKVWCRAIEMLRRAWESGDESR